MFSNDAYAVIDLMEYRTTEGDRWDSISYTLYGESDRYNDIIRANPGLPESVKLAPLLPGNIRLVIPDLIQTKREDLPPWRKG